MVASSTNLDSHPLNQLLRQIELAASGGFHLIAIGMAVALPDICVSLSSQDGRSDGVRYKAWCASNLIGSGFSYVTGDDLYSMRCGVLHNGRFGDLKHNVARVVFVPPNPMGMVINNGKIDDAYVYNAVDFCKNMCAATRAWLKANIQDPQVEANSVRMMQYYPGGLAPYVQGIEVIA